MSSKQEENRSETGVSIRKVPQRWLLPLVAAIVLVSMPAHAGLIVTITPVSVAAGSAGVFDVTLQNTGGAETIGSFSIGLSVASNSGITFNGGNESTTLSYIYTGNSFDIINSFPYTTVPPPSGLDLEGSDLANNGIGPSIATGSTVGLGHILFATTSNANLGEIAVTILSTCNSADSCTSLADNTGAALAFTASSGDITITAGTEVPEPSTWSLALLFLVPLCLLAAKRRACRPHVVSRAR